MEQLIKIEVGKLKRHHKKKFDLLEKAIKRLDFWIRIGMIVVILLQIISLLT